ncbi:MAG: ATP-binding cassette domain-containing protein [bacterium]
MIEIKNVSFKYADGMEALIDFSASFPPEHIFAVLGESGSGKTTLLNCISRFLTPQKGSILIDGENIYDMDELDFRRKLGVVFQDLYLFPHLTILENMTLAPCNVQNLSPDQASLEALEMLTRLGIADIADSYSAQVSGGQAQRAAIARGLMLKPEYMMLDEPTAALDAGTTREFAEWLRELQADSNFIIVTHDVPFAKSVASRGIFMHKGRKINSGNIKNIIDVLESEFK